MFRALLAGAMLSSVASLEHVTHGNIHVFIRLHCLPPATARSDQRLMQCSLAQRNPDSHFKQDGMVCNGSLLGLDHLAEPDRHHDESDQDANQKCINPSQYPSYTDQL